MFHVVAELGISVVPCHHTTLQGKVFSRCVGFKTIMANPAVGRAKSGDLQGVLVYKYKLGNKQILLAYEVVDSTLYLYTFGSHLNFYRELSKYIHQQVGFCAA